MCSAYSDPKPPVIYEQYLYASVLGFLSPSTSFADGVWQLLLFVQLGWSD